MSLPLTVQNGTLYHPAGHTSMHSAKDYAPIQRALEQVLRNMTTDENGINGLLCALEDCLSFVPAALQGDEGDISLYDHSKMTGAIAACVSEYLLDRKEESFRSRLEEGAQQFCEEQAFLLYSADISGIQKFIFTVANSGALPSLRSRSFFLELMMEHYIDELLSACAVSRVNLLYSGGGHCYLLLPNTQGVIAAVEAWNERFNEWLLDSFGTGLFVAHGWTACCGNDLTNTPAAQAPYTAMFRRVSSAISAHKLHRYSPKQLIRINRHEAQADGRECIVCGRSDLLRSDGRCTWCNLFVRMSVSVLESSVYLVSNDRAGSDFALPGWQDMRYISLLKEEAAFNRIKNGEAVVRTYTKNRSIAGLPNATRLYVGDYAAAREMETLTAGAQGISRLGVCRMDVDNLGHAFVSGYRRVDCTDVEQRDRYLNISRTSAFSRQMSVFFKCLINPILERPKADGGKLSVAIVYSGGDDVFLLGAWNDVITAAQRIQESFAQFCGGALTLSGGISIHDDHFPIRLAASHSAALEDCAKQMPGKNALALFEANEDNAYSWDVFRENVMKEKLQTLQDFFGSEEQERGKSFLYQLMNLLRDARKAPIYLARYAYLLAKMEPAAREKKDAYNAFSKKMYEWAISPEERRQLITAIYLFIYMERKES